MNAMLLLAVLAAATAPSSEVEPSTDRPRATILDIFAVPPEVPIPVDASEWCGDLPLPDCRAELGIDIA